MKVRVGFIGLGIMGRPMARNLLKAGYPLSVYNRSRPAVDELASLGAYPASSSAEVAARSDVVITMLPDSPDVRQVALGSGGIIEGAREGMIYVDMSTISPKVTREIADILGGKGVKMLDAPVSGGDVGAREGTLSIMVGGTEEAFRECLPIFEVLGSNVVHVGGIGMGQTVKLCNQIICGLNILAVCEGLAFGAKAGVDLGKMLEVVSKGAARSWMLENLAPRMLEGNLEPGFMVRLQQKDLRLALSAADEFRASLPGTALVNQLFRALEAAGMGDKGTQALVTVLWRLSGMEWDAG